MVADDRGGGGAGPGGAEQGNGTAADEEPPTEPDHTTLRLVHLPSPPDLGALDVKRRAEGRLLGGRAVVRVLGSSHCLSLPDRGLHELCSCRPLPDLGVAVDDDRLQPDGGGRPRLQSGVAPDATMPDATDPGGRICRVPLAPGVERSLAATVGDLRIETAVEGLALEAFPDRDWDVSYRFAPDALTAVALDGDRFVTFHTYPEFDLALRSETLLEWVE